jgi:hypothetical protein
VHGCTFTTGSRCTIDTGSGCTFTTGYECVVVRRDVYKVIELKGERHKIVIDGKEVEISNKIYKALKESLDN